MDSREKRPVEGHGIVLAAFLGVPVFVAVVGLISAVWLG